jgi:hypothetical protein
MPECLKWQLSTTVPGDSMNVIEQRMREQVTIPFRCVEPALRHVSKNGPSGYGSNVSLAELMSRIGPAGSYVETL